MAFREVSVVQIKELLRRWLAGEGERPIARAAGVARTTARNYPLPHSGSSDQVMRNSSPTS
jgi:hypothetical protein